MSPQPDALRAVRIGDGLRVEIRRLDDRAFVVAINAEGQTVGTIGSGRAITLIECIDKGFAYVADVQSLDEGACRVLVHLANP